ncbi:exo-beta-N-acetylmuramidase NamZ family protein [Bergeyella cardium]|nr:DUF1343 domain-containing protein [Bergeyella cardium]WHE33031.1 DUF1343 domain-containing protein [Bergeyella cardium]WHF59681.1 DUF1343 domain-containing protein [Bergeyella cardium]
MNLAAKIKNLVSLSLIFCFSTCLFAQSNEFKTGADQPEIYLPLLKGKAVGVVTNQTGLVLVKTKYNAAPRGRGCSLAMRTDSLSIVDFLLRNAINVKKVFAPEHGFRGDADAGESVRNGIDTQTQLPIISLYGKNKKPTADQLKDLDIILFDIQDVGIRFYTYISTLALVMEAAAENQKEVIILDRPNPHDGYIDGPVLKPQWASFVGMHPIPVVYGLTIGEYGLMANGEGWLKNKAKAKYTVIKLKNYHKKQRYSLPKPPSPNLPNALAISLYPSLCFFEGTAISVGRGTPTPFQIYGSPHLKPSAFSFTPQPSYGAKSPFLNGEHCYGENLQNEALHPTRLELKWLISAYKNFDDKRKADFFLSNLFFDKLAGSDELRKQIQNHTPEEEIRQSWATDLQKFQKIRQKYLLYPD